jgi:hypothetical protein
MVADLQHRPMFWTRAPRYDPKEDLEGIIAKLMSMDEKLEAILVRLGEDDDVDEEET